MALFARTWTRRSSFVVVVFDAAALILHYTLATLDPRSFLLYYRPAALPLSRLILLGDIFIGLFHSLCAFSEARGKFKYFSTANKGNRVSINV